MRKILFMGGLGFGGAERQMIIVAKALQIRNCDVFFLTYNIKDFYSDYLENSGVEVVKIPKNALVTKLKLSVLSDFIYAYRFTKKEHIKVGVSFLGSWNFVNCLIAMFNHGKFNAITGLRNARESLLLSKREIFYTKFERFAKCKVCNSENALHLYAKCFPQYSCKLTTIYNIVKLPEIVSLYKPRINDKTHIVVPASYRDVKNPNGLIEALSLMTNDERELFEITWYGETGGEVSNYYLNLINEVKLRGLDNTLILKESTKDIANIMNSADAVALFSSSEGLPNAICEGMMLEKPIIMTRVSDYDRLVTDCNGVLCDWNDADSIRDAIKTLALMPTDVLLKMGKCSRIVAEKLFSESNNIDRWMSVVLTRET